MNAVKRIDTVFLQVANLEDAISWYKDVFGFNSVFERHERHERYTVLEVGETAITLMEKNSVNKDALTHPILYFFADDIEKTHYKVKEHSLACSDITSEDGVTFFEFKDLDGNPLGVCHF
ncbi:VOC family protein [Salipaludibacillus agaradhaerens]|jgi:predicted enzyme related to lactoylglutathione lyase|uniref:VOC family protein n=1 Tax=Salipaludibacillus agaradhaerens TaxID=76935 RepID=A0A9Q4FYE0_SALAG|nr:VOC family protein [Salipaludibacillus agaradhaerens]MCR6097560.1 VOC family protein [Salipaludibacillus agaradhaerens]MCR6112956.1 VOC family protein [Salipaludibacillus agaradhaerens]